MINFIIIKIIATKNYQNNCLHNYHYDCNGDCHCDDDDIDSGEGRMNAMITTNGKCEDKNSEDED